jgi:copper oxidase (laccase) domain-containing protein
MLDLAEANRKQLEAAGVPEGQIHQGAPCTCCSENEFHSYRRERAHSGRMISLIGILDDRTG